MPYQNFKTALYCPVSSLSQIKEWDTFDTEFSHIEKNVWVDKVYLEVFGGGKFVTREHLESCAAFFREKGMEVSGGLGTSDRFSDERFGYVSLCYTNPEHRQWLKDASELAASLFDEIILDDFFFTNCKCVACVKAKGQRSWAQYRLKLMREVSRDLVIGPAKAVNPKVSLIIKYPNWYDCYQETGYNQKDEPGIFDRIYTGTETRDPQFTPQHLPKYLGYFLMRYHENLAPGRNGGGWFDIYECGRSPALYTSQAELTILAGAREATMYSLGELLQPHNRIYAPLAGTTFASMDKVAAELGKPLGAACYKPFFSNGEDYLHPYIGMLGIALEPYAEYPASAKRILLTESAACDPDIISKVQLSLLNGANVVVTSGFVRATGDFGFKDLANVCVTGRRASVQQYGLSPQGRTFEEMVAGDQEVTLPWLQFATNDTWQLVFGLCENNNLPVLLAADYGNGKLFVLTIPDNPAEMSHFPRKVLDILRNILTEGFPAQMRAPAGICYFPYDNDTFAVVSFREHPEEIDFLVAKNAVELVDLTNDQVLTGVVAPNGTRFSMTLQASQMKAYRIRHAS